MQTPKERPATSPRADCSRRRRGRLVAPPLIRQQSRGGSGRRQPPAAMARRDRCHSAGAQLPCHRRGEPRRGGRRYGEGEAADFRAGQRSRSTAHPFGDDDNNPFSQVLPVDLPAPQGQPPTHASGLGLHRELGRDHSDQRTCGRRRARRSPSSSPIIASTRPRCSARTRQRHRGAEDRCARPADGAARIPISWAWVTMCWRSVRRSVSRKPRRPASSARRGAHCRATATCRSSRPMPRSIPGNSGGPLFDATRRRRRHQLADL